MNASPDTPSVDTSSADTATGAASPHDPAAGESSFAAAPPEADAAPPPRRAWLPWLGAAAVGGGLVLGAVAIASLLSNRDTGVSVLDARLAGLELQLRELAARPLPPDARAVDELTARLGKVEAAPAPASDPALANRVAALEGGVNALTETVAVLGRRSDEAAAAARDAVARADAASAALAELKQQVAHLSAPSVARGEFDAVADRVAGLEKSEKAAVSDDRALRLALAATALAAAVARGDAFAPELATVTALGADPKATAALAPFAATGVPSAAALARELAAIAPSLRPAADAPAGESFLHKLQLNAEKLVRVRPLDGAAGSDSAAIVARVEGKAARADVAGALAELAQLPPAARAPAEAWIKKAQAREATVAASRRLAADTLAGLGK
jgi:hypothetical protein